MKFNLIPNLVAKEETKGKVYNSNQLLFVESSNKEIIFCGSCFKFYENFLKHEYFFHPTKAVEKTGWDFLAVEVSPKLPRCFLVSDFVASRES